MKKTILLIALMLGITLNAQTAFEKGNFVNKQNQVVECLIKNYDWASIPKEIEYKINENDDASTVPASQLNSFYIYGTAHNYKTYDVPVIGIQKGDVFVKSGPQLLKVLVDGKASLLKNNDGIYILAPEGETLKPLIYKRYINGDRYEENVAFRLELYNTLKCKSLKIEDFKKLKYNDNQLVKVVNEYNKCMGGESQSYTVKKSKADFNISFVAGANFYTVKRDFDFALDFEEGYTDYSDQLEFKSGGVNVALGLDIEVKLPFNHSQWAIFLLPLYGKQNDRTVTKANLFDFFSNDYKYNVTTTITGYSYIELPLGVRRYVYLKNGSALNFSLAAGMSFGLGSEVQFNIKKSADSPEKNLTIVDSDKEYSPLLVRIGAGYTIKDKYNVSLNYYPVKSFEKYNTNGSISVLLGYKIL